MKLVSKSFTRFDVCAFLIVTSVFLIPIAVSAQQTVTTTGGTTGYIPKFSGAATVVKSLIFDTGTTVGIGVGATPNSAVKLDIGGGMIVRGNTIVSRTGNATAAQGYPSWEFRFTANSYNSSTKAGDNPFFALRSEPSGNNTASPSATFNLLFSNNGAAEAETGFYINPNGTLHFASAQTFPIAAGPQGPAGPTGPQGPAGGLSLPYLGVSYTASGPVFEIQNSVVSGGIAIAAIGGDAPDTGVDGGAGLYGQGGFGSPNVGQTTGGAGVYGEGGTALRNDAFFPQQYGGYGGDGGHFVGGYARAGSKAGYGVEAFGGAADSQAVAGVGLYATYGAGTGNITAAEFNGDVSVFGSVSKSGGSFKIDDPLDPANKYLSHSFVESPDMKNVYDGTVTTDGSGTAVVAMPVWFEALNRDYRYQLTVIGQFAQAIVGSKIANGAFTIRTDKPNVEVSWQVTGIRQDAWANAHRIPVEEDKPESEKGHYTHPELFGHAGEPSIMDMRHPRPGAGSGPK